MKHIWIDLANSPQVLFFSPIITEMRRRGYELTITTRHFAQTIELAERLGIDHTPIGSHAGEKGILASLWVNYLRARHQVRFLKGKQIDLAISHNAYAQAIASLMLKIPLVTAMDYEHQRGNHLPFRVAKLVIVPEAFPDHLLKRYGAREVIKYSGVKEQIYLADFVPAPDYRQQIGLPQDKIVVLVRPPATWALYHKGISNHLIGEILKKLGRRTDVQMVFLPRIETQKAAIRTLNLPNIWIPDKALDGPNLICASDIVLSAGGTMNREAAVLGVPVYSVFAGKLGAVDQYLVDKGRMQVLTDVDQLKVGRRVDRLPPLPTPGRKLVQEVTDAFLSVL
jgi:hypothetical protein